MDILFFPAIIKIQNLLVNFFLCNVIWPDGPFMIGMVLGKGKMRHLGETFIYQKGKHEYHKNIFAHVCITSPTADCCRYFNYLCGICTMYLLKDLGNLMELSHFSTIYPFILN